VPKVHSLKIVVTIRYHVDEVAQKFIVQTSLLCLFEFTTMTMHVCFVASNHYQIIFCYTCLIIY
jgi:hypothetical protein